MLSPSPKFLGLPPVFGLSPRLTLSLTVGLIALGAVAAVSLDRMTRGDSANKIAEQPISTEIFETPGEAIVRSEIDDPSLPWHRNAAAFPANDPAPRLAIVVVDDGLDSSAAMTAMRLGVPLTLAIAPTADSADKRAATARQLGREVLLLLPMESESAFDSAPNPIAMHVPRSELLRRMKWNLAQIDGYVGVMNQYGEATTRDAQTMRAVMEVVQSEGLAFIDARSHENSLGSAVARRMGVPTGERVIGISRGADAAELGAGLASGLRHAERWGTAIVTVPAERRLVAALQDWISAKEPGVKLTPVTAILSRLRSGKN